NFILIKEENDLKSEYLYYPQVYITDIYSIHNFFIHSIREDMFWEQFQLCVLEDCNNYTEAFGSNSAYVIRRLLSKLESFNKEYQLLCTTKPINNRIEHISKLTGVKEFKDVANIDSAEIPSFEVFNWYPPINHINYDRSGITVTRENFNIELGNLIRGLIETSPKENYTAVLWQKYFIASDDIANLTRKFNISEEYKNNIIIGNNINEIRLSLLQQDKKLDLSNLSSVVIVGVNKPLNYYLTDLMHIGVNPKQIYFFDTQSPSLQYQIMKYLRNPKEIEKLSPTEKPIDLNLNDVSIISQHWNFLKDEQPNISSNIIEKYFPDIFISTIGKNNISTKGSYLILNKDLKFFPKEKRTNEQLHLSSFYNFFDLVLIEGEAAIQIGEMADYEVRAKCYSNKILVYKNNKYFIRNIDWNNRKINLDRYVAEPQQIYKLSNYFNFIFEPNNLPQQTSRLNDRVLLLRGITQISEQILNLKSTQNFEDYSTIGVLRNNSFENARLNFIEFRFPIQLFQRFYPPEQNPPVNQNQQIEEQEQVEDQNNQLNEEQRREQIYTAIFPIIHAFGHLLVESIRVNNLLPLDEIKIFIPSLDNLIVTNEPENEEEQPQTEWNYCSLYLIDLTNRNTDILDALFQNDLIPLLKIMRDILLNCPCEVGSNTCIKVDYCNIDNCGITNQQIQADQQNQRYVVNPDNSITDTVNRLNKINTLRFICDLLDEQEERINTYIRWKRWIPERNLNSCIYENDKLQDMVKTAQLIINSKSLLKIEKFYNSRFFSAQEINENTPLGLTTPLTKAIAFRPGLNENELFETIFHEYFHNYEFDTNKNNIPKNNIHPSLLYFDWDHIDNPKSIPYIGLLVVEGAAVWFSLRMMEIFSDFSYLRYIVNPRTRFMEYRAGLQLLIELERKLGYKKVFEFLKNSFRVVDYQNSFLNVINEEIDRYLSEVNQQRLQGLWCLQINQQLNNINRVTYFLRIQLDRRRNEIGLQDMISKRDRRVAHITEDNIRRYAYMPTDQYVQDAQIIRILNKYGLPSNMQWGENNGFICEGCATNCNLFTACMLNGGRNIFREILLAKFPPPTIISFFRRILRRIFRRN
ncbi:MAG: hypothetical protein QXG00_06595, partial [Candidatus Woesearchaeota archaeon]